MTWASIAVAGGTALLSSVTGGKERKRQEKLEQQAAAQEDARRQQIDYATTVIDRTFDSPARQRQYQDYLQAIREHLTSDLERQKADADRQSTFALARAGLTGGSAAVDANRKRNEEYLRGVLGVERRAQGSLADLMSADQASRLNLINLARGGLDATTAARRAADSMQASIAGTMPQAQAQGLGDVFSQSIATAQKQREASERRRALGHRADIYSAGGL